MYIQCTIPAYPLVLHSSRYNNICIHDVPSPISLLLKRLFFKGVYSESSINIVYVLPSATGSSDLQVTLPRR